MNSKYVKINPVTEIDKILYKYYINKCRKGWIEVGESKTCMPEYYAEIADDVENLEIRDSDVLVCSHPKTGTTWMQEMVWMIIHNLDFEGAKEEIGLRFPFIENQCLFDYRDDDLKEEREKLPDTILKSVELVRNYSRYPRLIKTHLPFNLLPKQIRNRQKKPKIIYVMRNPKDTCVSFYYHSKLLVGYKGNLEDFCKLFMAGRLTWGPFFKNILSYVNNQEKYDILLIKYEEMKNDLRSIIRKVATYLGKTLTEEQISKLQDHLSFEKMKNNPSVNMEHICVVTRKVNNSDGSFMRSGNVGNYKENLSEEMIQQFDEWTKKETEGTSLTFDC